MRIFFVGITLLLCSMGSLANNQFIDFTVDSSKSRHVSFIFETQEPVEYKHFVLSTPDRLVLDFKKTGLGKIKLQSKENALVNAIRSRVAKDTTRVVLDLSPHVSSKVQLLTGRHGAKTRVKIELTQLKTSEKPRTLLAKTKQKLVKAKQQLNKASHQVKKIIAKKIDSVRDKTIAKLKVALPKVDELRDIVVIIDPGHGGKDPGATGRHRNREKNVVLAVSKQLKDAIDKEPGFKAKMTREGDYFLSLRHRMRIARENKADMFIAIHADAYKNSQAHGASVYAVSERGATSEAARWLAERENRSELIGGVKLSDKENVLRSVLIDLSQTATTGASLEVGHDILHQLGLIGHLHHGEVEQAAFVVLKAPDIPSVLVETGFLSNSREEHLLTSKSYQAKLAQAIHRGVRDYFYRRSPRGTLVSALKQGMIRHRVAMGESLSSIAREYHTSIASLQRLNKVQGTKIFIGQELRIPKFSG